MKRRILLVLSVLLILAGIFLLIRVAAETLKPRGRGALQVTTNTRAQVFLDNKSIGETPLCRCEQNETLNEGVYELKIVPNDKSVSPFSLRVEINPGVLTAVDRTFLPGSFSSTYILTLKKTNARDSQVFVASIPDEALVSLDGDSKGVTPLTLKGVSASEHEMEIQKQGFAKKTVRIRAVPSHKLILNVILGAEGEIDETQDVTPQPKADSRGLGTPAPTVSKNSVLIKSTPTGFLRVRKDPTTAAVEIGRVKPGETYEFVDENDSWFKIKLSDGAEGWVSKTYTSIQ